MSLVTLEGTPSPLSVEGDGKRPDCAGWASGVSPHRLPILPLQVQERAASGPHARRYRKRSPNTVNGIELGRSPLVARGAAGEHTETALSYGAWSGPVARLESIP